MNDRYGFNPRKCNSVSTLNGCIEREMPRVIIALHSSNEVFDIFEQTINAGFSCINNCLAFDTEIFLLNVTKQTNEKDNEIDRKDYNYKVWYNLRLNNEEMQPKRIVAKILKLDENNQYGFGMTKPLLTVSIKIDSDISFQKLNDLIRKLDIDLLIRHLYVVDIEFDHKNATQNQIAYNEVYPLIIEKQKIIDRVKDQFISYFEQYSTTEKGKPRSYRAPKKAHATMFKNRFQPTYLEQFFFAVVSAGWKIRKIYTHYTFEQERFKKHFILMNQMSRQNAKNSVEKGFCKLMIMIVMIVEIFVMIVEIIWTIVNLFLFTMN